MPDGVLPIFALRLARPEPGGPCYLSSLEPRDGVPMEDPWPFAALGGARKFNTAGDAHNWLADRLGPVAWLFEVVRLPEDWETRDEAAPVNGLASGHEQPLPSPTGAG